MRDAEDGAFVVELRVYSSLLTENGSNYTVIAKETAGLNKLNNSKLGLFRC